MSQQKMSIKGRIVHMLSFEFIALLIVIPLSYFVLKKNAVALGALAVILAIAAMLWNFIYNWLFDVIENKCGGMRFKRKFWLRVVHACLFELSLCLVSVPFVIMLLHLPFIAAFTVNLGFVFFYLCYALVFNYIYDHIYMRVVNAQLRRQKRNV
ncbi:MULTISPECIES: PACE efflux transporter [Cysteiniphilum]|nr:MULTISPECIES: PACE efflux transporter [Cysteiniphilum]WHN65267.1 PACE efflux transporter [Cysteiniphilum sp. QT6929]